MGWGSEIGGHDTAAQALEWKPGDLLSWSQSTLVPKHNGISQGVLEEGQQHFKTDKEMLEWLEKQG